MIRNIFLISRDSGTCIYHKSYVHEDQQDSSIITGYLTALSDFSEEIGGQAKEMKLENKILKYKFIDENILLCFDMDMEKDTEKITRNNEAMEEIIEKFKELYPEGLDINGDLSEFYGRNKLDELVFDKIIYDTLFFNRQLSDFLDERVQYLKNILK